MTQHSIAVDELSAQLRQEALHVQEDEPQLSVLLQRTVLAPGVVSFEDAVAASVCYRLLLQPCSGPNNGEHMQPTAMFCPHSLRGLFRECMSSQELELGHTMSAAIREDALAVCRRDPATDTVLEVVLFSKGFAALVCHRAAYQLWKFKHKNFTALFLQSQASAVFGVDLHPLCKIGWSVMLDHGTGIVVGETAEIGDGCTLLHGVTLGGTGKELGDRHPKVGRNVLIGAGTSLLGNIVVGDGCKIGAGSVVLRDIPPGATAVGAPAKIIGRASESKPGSEMDETLLNVSLLHKSESNVTTDPSSDDLAEQDDEEMYEAGAHKGSRPSVSVCPYRVYANLACSAPPESITIFTLNDLLAPHGCTPCEIGACLFQLDTTNVGHVKTSAFRAHAVDVITKCTKLDRPLAESITASFLARNSAW
jgi:serine O-acetyltransferase